VSEGNAPPPCAAPSPRIVHRKNRAAWLAGTGTLFLLLLLLRACIRARVVAWDIFFRYLFDAEILLGVGNAFLIGTLSLLLASALGFGVAIARMSGNPILTVLSAAYVYLFRGIPMLLQIIFWYNSLPIMFPRIHIVVPLLRLTLVDVQMIDVVTPFRAALIGISLAETAYMAEIIRGGISSIDRGQREAALALGLRRGQVMRRVILPQAFRTILPSVGNEYINLMKSTSLAMTIGFMEVLRVVTNIYYTTFEVVELLCVACFWYLFLGSFATLLQTVAERLYPKR